MIKSSNEDTPFSLTCGTEAVIPAEIGMPTYRTATVDIVRNDDEIRLNLDLVEERREQAAIREARAKSKMMRYYNARVRGVTFKPGDYVYRSNEASHAMDGGKLRPKWEGPYEVTEVLGGGAYKLRSMDGAVLPRTSSLLAFQSLRGKKCKKSVKKTESGKDESSSRGEGGKKKMSTFVNALSSIARGAQQTSEHMMENQPGATQTTSQKGKRGNTAIRTTGSASDMRSILGVGVSVE
ncbi:hypothetical protein Tco_1428102 [Tanacetum coccineum]